MEDSPAQHEGERLQTRGKEDGLTACMDLHGTVFYRQAVMGRLRNLEPKVTEGLSLITADNLAGTNCGV